jgi:hypothetical protein
VADESLERSVSLSDSRPILDWRPRLQLGVTVVALVKTVGIPRAVLGGGLVVAAFALSGCGADGPASTPVRTNPPVSILEEVGALRAHPETTLQTMRSLGVRVARVLVAWSWLAADSGSRTRPARDPYPATHFASYDRIVRAAQADGIELDFLLSGRAPDWAAERGLPHDPFPGAWKPSPPAFERFVETVASRYSGHYAPPGASSPLPRVHFWEIWNEPNWAPSLEPQLALHPYRTASAGPYRLLLDAGWRALQRTGHAHDTIVIGNLSPRGTPGTPSSSFAAATGVASPLGFTRTLYCVDSSYRRLQGAVAALAGCPVTAAASRRFAESHPALFQASGYGMHPYPVNLPPTEADTTNPDTVEFSQIPHLETALDRVLGVYGAHRQMSIFNTEYGYITNPPNRGTEYLSPTRAAIYLNWAEYLTWRNPRMASSMQYGLIDVYLPQSPFGPGGFASALIAYTGQPKATFYAYRMPVFLPVTRAARGQALEVWGCARPAPYAYQDTRRAQYVQIQFRPGSGGKFRTVRSAHLVGSRGCYFDVDVNFPSSGAVRLQWSYPRGDPRLLDPATPGQTTVYSREVPITIQ